ncbi:hypothetical protein KPB05_38140 [Burkholderia gladioli]|uniref:hypothetical protein n=1 Tax=Burkholderia gladioli TaxID=28095 RepID=UPI00285CC127|nr:hypothetical protein [Burkholderia gladioli]MDR8093282.1 hypothetical protein [Burkholderia gladioli]
MNSQSKSETMGSRKLTRGTVARDVFDVAVFRTQKTRAQCVSMTTPGTRVTWCSLKEWIAAWKQINARAASSKKHRQRAAHVAVLASNIGVVNREMDIETLAAAKQLIERENMLPPRGNREGHPATEILQRVGTVLNERRRGGSKAGVGVRVYKTRLKVAA